MNKLMGLYAVGKDHFSQIYSQIERREIEGLVHVYGPLQSAASLRDEPEILGPCEVIFSGWGGPRLDKNLLKYAPNLKLILYAGGSAREHLTEAMWARGIRLSSAYRANALPVVEYTLAAILFSLKHGWRYATNIRKNRAYPVKWTVPGGYGSTVGLVSMGMVARILLDRLKGFDLDVVTYDPFLSHEEADKLGVRLVSLEELFEVSDVVSLHSPALSETEGMITGSLIAAMKEDATLINTARGSLINENGLIEVASKRPDLQIVLDVTEPEPPVPGSPLYTLPNVVLTPHIAGSMNGECRRMGRDMVAELKRFISGEPLQWEITPELARVSSHRPIFMDTANVALSAT